MTAYSHPFPSLDRPPEESSDAAGGPALVAALPGEDRVRASFQDDAQDGVQDDAQDGVQDDAQDHRWSRVRSHARNEVQEVDPALLEKLLVWGSPRVNVAPGGRRALSFGEDSVVEYSSDGPARPLLAMEGVTGAVWTLEDHLAVTDGRTHVLLLRATEHGLFPVDEAAIGGRSLWSFGGGRYLAASTGAGQAILGVKKGRLKILCTFRGAPQSARVQGDHIHFGRGPGSVTPVNLDPLYEQWMPREAAEPSMSKQKKAIDRGLPGFRALSAPLPLLRPEDAELFGPEDRVMVHPTGRVLGFPRRPDRGRSLAFVEEGLRVDVQLPCPLPSGAGCKRGVALWISPDNTHMAIAAEGKIFRIPFSTGEASQIADLSHGARAPRVYAVALVGDDRFYAALDGRHAVFELGTNKALRAPVSSFRRFPAPFTASPSGDRAVVCEEWQDASRPTTVVRVYDLTDEGARELSRLELCGFGVELFLVEGRPPIALTAYGAFELVNLDIYGSSDFVNLDI